MKICKTCGKEKPFNEFNKLRASKDGYSLHCRSCTNLKRKEYKKQHKEEIKKSYKKYYNKNKEILKEKSQAFREKNKEITNLKMKEYYKEHKEKIKQYAKEYYKLSKRNNLDPSYSKKERDREFFATIKNKGGYNKVPYSNRNILTFQQHFYEKEKEIWKNDKVKKYIYLNREKYLGKNKNELTDREILRAFKISGKYYGFSHFSPYWVKAFIEEFAIKSIYDPCGGWGHRLLGAWNIDYIYNDIDTRTYQGVKNIYDDYKNFNNFVKKFYNNDAFSFIPKEKYEAVFTCPPYYNIEKYTWKFTSTKVFNNYNEWINIWWDKVVKNCNPSKYFSFVINETYKDDMSKIIEKNGYSFLKEIKLGKTKSHYTNGKNEILVIFKSYI